MEKTVHSTRVTLHYLKFKGRDVDWEVITKKIGNHHREVMGGSMKLIYLHKKVQLIKATDFWMTKDDHHREEGRIKMANWQI